MVKIHLYHGTNVEFDILDPTLSRLQLDFGQGCYLTLSESQAQGMARRKYSIMGGKKIVLEYLFDIQLLNETDIKIFKGYTPDWTKFVIKNRYFKDYRCPYKLIIGPVADGTMPDDIEDYMLEHPDDWELPENIELLTEKLKFNNEPSYIQYCFSDRETINKSLNLIRKNYE